MPAMAIAVLRWRSESPASSLALVRVNFGTAPSRSRSVRVPCASISRSSSPAWRMAAPCCGCDHGGGFMIAAARSIGPLSAREREEGRGDA
jgi:hypothetical protein